MRLALIHYLKGLKERNELELVLVNLMNAMGLTVLSEPGWGTKQDGVDILAVGKFPGEKEDKVFLLTAKSGDITRSTWTGGPQCLLESLEEIVHSYIPTALRADLRALPKEVCVCFGGMIKEDVRRFYNGFVENAMKSYPALHLNFREWNGSEIAGLVEKYFMNSQLFVGSGQRLILRAMAMVEEPQTAIELFCEFLKITQKESENESVVKRAMHLSQVSLCLDLILKCCEEVGNLEAGYRCAEYALLWAWDYLGIPNGDVTTQNQQKPTVAFQLIWAQHVSIAQSYFAKLARVAEGRFTFSLACKSRTEVDVNKRAFDVLGRIAAFGSELLNLKLAKSDEKMPADAKESFWGIIRGLVRLLKQIIEYNPTTLSPLRDDYAFEFSMISLFLLQVGERSFLHDWIFKMLRKQEIHFITGRGYPSIGLSYADLYEHMQTGHDDEYRKRVLVASVLFPMIAYVSAIADFDDCFEKLQKLRDTYLPNCDLQMWFPDADTDKYFYRNRRIHGKSRTSIQIVDKNALIKRVADDCEKSPFAFSCAHYLYQGLVYLGCRCYRYPLPPHLLKAYYDYKMEQERSGNGAAANKAEAENKENGLI